MKLRDDITICVMDDDEGTARCLRSALERRQLLRLVEAPADPRGLLDGKATPELLLVDPVLASDDPQAFLEGLTADALPLVIVVTSDRDLAVPSFERGVVDFLPKPVDEERLALALDRGIGGVHARREERAFKALSRARQTSTDGKQAPFPGRILIREQGRAYFVDTSRIRFIRSDGNYVRIYDDQGYHLVRTTMSQIMELLDESRFVRIHRSTIVNIKRVQEFVPDMKGRYVVRLEGGTDLVLSRSYRDHVLSRAL